MYLIQVIFCIQKECIEKFIFVVLNAVFSLKIAEIKGSLAELSVEADFNFSKKGLQSKCPDSAGGDDQSYLRIKYFYSDYCPWCKREEPILQKLTRNYGNLIYIYGKFFMCVESYKYLIAHNVQNIFLEA